MPFYLNGTEIDNLYLNGVEVDTAYLNGVKVYSSGPSTIGEFYEGGYYFGTLGGYYLLCAPIAGQTNFKAWATTSSVLGASSTTDGYSNTYTMYNSGVSPSADWAWPLVINGKSDWYIPSKDEISLLSQVHETLESAGAGTFENYYQTSTEVNSTNYYYCDFWTDAFYSTNKSNSNNVRVIRRVSV